MAITLADIKLRARQRADMVNSEFVEDNELTNYINASLAELHDLLIEAYAEDYYMESLEFAADGSQSYALPNGTNYSGAPKFYKLRGVDARAGQDTWTTVKRFNFNRRNTDQDSVASSMLYYPGLEYRLVGSEVRFIRAPDPGTEIRLWYYPQVTELVNGSDAYDDINGYSEYVVVDTAIKMLQKEESDVAVLMAQKEALRQRIMAAAANRDANEPEAVQDIYAEDAEYYAFGRD